MEKNIIYHGSNVEVPNPKILVNGQYKDFGSWLSSNIQRIRLFSAQKKHYKHCILKGA